jgi:NAD+ synthase
MNNLSINSKTTAEKIVLFLQKTLKKAGHSKIVLGLSGGIDSAVSASLAVGALGEASVHVGIFPYGDLNQEGERDAFLITRHLAIPQPNIHRIDIKSIIDTTVEKAGEMDELRKGNIMARTRMILLYDLSKKLNALVLGTENKTEHLLGYFTRFGDEASDIEPIRSFYKTQVRQLAAYLKLPEKIITKAPTAGMWQGQTDEKEFGFTYEEADQILHLYVDKKMNPKEIGKEGFSQKTIECVLGRIKKNEFKRNVPFLL